MDPEIKEQIEADSWLSEVTQELLFNDSEEVVQECLHSLCDYLNADRCAVFARNEAQGHFERLKQYCKAGADSFQELYLVETLSWSAQLLDQGKPVVIHNCDGLPAEAEGEKRLMESERICSTISTPIRLPDGWMGCLDVEMLFEVREWRGVDIRLVQRFGEVLAGALLRFNTLAALKASDERFRLAMEASREGIWDWNMASGAVYYSPGWMAMLGYEAKAVEGHYTMWYDYLHPEDRETAAQQVQEHIENRDDSFEVEFRLKCTSGKYKWVLSQGRVVTRDTTGMPLRIVGTHTDITDRKEAEVSLDLARSQAEKAAREEEEAYRIKSVFLANMSHEVRTPLTAISGLIALLERTELDEQQRDYLNKLNLSRSLLMSLVNNMLDYSKIETGKFSIHSEATDLRRLLIEVVTVVKMKFINTGIDFEIKVPSGCPRWFRFDGIRVKQVLLNLLMNAFKFTPQGKVSLLLEQLEDAGQSYLKFSIVDTGIGIPKEKQAMLFNAFYQVDEGNSRSYEGTGLGLAISQKLADLMDGKLEVASEMGQGSCFSFTIGVILFEGEDDVLGDFSQYDFDAVHVSKSALVASQSDNEEILKVLVVDDNQMNRDIFVDLIREVGFQVEPAASGTTAIERVSKEGFDLVLLDIMMPIVDGYQTAHSIHQKLGVQRPKLIALTASASIEVRERCLASGFDAFMVKPLEIENLLQEVQRLFPEKVKELSGIQIDRSREINVQALDGFNTLKKERLLSLVSMRHNETSNPFIEKVLCNYLESATQLVNEVRIAHEEGKRDELQKKVHSLGGISSTIGADTLTEICMCAESRLTKNADSRINMFLEMLYREFGEIEAEVKGFLQKNCSANS